MAITSTSSPSFTPSGRTHTDYRAMSIATALFFMWGFLTSLNDVLIPHLKSIFTLSNAESALIQTAFFGAYFVFAMPGGKLVEWRGYKQTMVIGLLVAALGAILFIPAATAASYPLFLGALIVLATGITFLQVAANPYVTSIGPDATASSRLNLSQAFNSLGTTVAPWVGGALILGGAVPLAASAVKRLAPEALQAYRAQQASTVKMPYIVITVLLVLLAVFLGLSKLERATDQNTSNFRPQGQVHESIWHKPWVLLGALAIFVYVGAEVSIGSFLIGYFGRPEIAGLTPEVAAHYVSYYWGGAMLGRFIGSGILTKVRAGILLGLFAAIAAGLVLCSMFTHGHVAMYTILAVGLFNSIMFPSIFSLGVLGLGELTSKGSGLLVQAIVGGAIIPFGYGKLADKVGYQHAFIIPVICYAYILFYGFANARREKELGAVPA